MKGGPSDGGCDLRFAPIPKTKLAFCNVPLLPVRGRGGKRLFLSATWGGAMHVFDLDGNERVVPYPEGGLGSYAFTRDLEDGFAWAVHTGGKITKIDLDAGRNVLEQDIPLQVISWGSDLTPDGYLVAEATPGDILVYDTRRERVAHMLRGVGLRNRYGHHVRTAPDGRVVVLLTSPDAEMIVLDPKKGDFERFEPECLAEVKMQTTIPSFLPDGRYGIPGKEGLWALDYPAMRESAKIPYPSEGEWKMFRDGETGRFFAHQATGPLYALGDDLAWEVRLGDFVRRVGHVRPDKVAELPDGGMAGLSMFGEFVEYAPGKPPRVAFELSNYGTARVMGVTPGEGAEVYTATFINMSFQKLDLTTGEGANFQPCQEESGQVCGLEWLDGKLWLACYHGAEITCYDPKQGGEWPENPRPVLRVGEEQMRPLGLKSDGRFLWTATRAKYGLLGGALTRIDPKSETRKVWRNIIPGQNPSSFEIDAERKRVFVGMMVGADQGSAPPIADTAGVVAFDMENLAPAWTAYPEPNALQVAVLCPVVGGVLPVKASAGEIALLDPDTGEVRTRHRCLMPESWQEWQLVVANGNLFVASKEGLFEYAFGKGLGRRLLDGPVGKPRPCGANLFFVRDYSVGLAEGVFASI